MSAVPVTNLTLEEYLEFDFNAEGRFEYFDGEIVEMSGGSPEHSLLASQIGRLLGNQRVARGCLVFNPMSESKFRQCCRIVTAM